jgi:hypothetical protein
MGKKRKIGITAVGSFSFFLNQKLEIRKFGGKWRVYFFFIKNCWGAREVAPFHARSAPSSDSSRCAQQRHFWVPDEGFGRGFTTSGCVE